MLGTYPLKVSSTTNTKPASKATKSRGTTTQSGETGPKTRSASSRRTQEQQKTVTRVIRSRTASDSDLGASSSINPTRSRRPSPASVKNTIPSEYLDSSSSTSSPDSSLVSNASLWAACNETMKKLSTIAKQGGLDIRRLKILSSRRPTTFEREVATDENLTLTAIRFLTSRNTWSLNSCHAYLPTIIENITSGNRKNQSIALDGLQAIADTWLEQISLFAVENNRGIGVDVVADERAEKANDCIKHFRDVVRKRDTLYKKLDEESVYKLDNILAKLKKA